MGTSRGPGESSETRLQSVEIPIELDEEAGEPCLCVGGELFRIGANLSGRFGFHEGTRLTERLFQILTFLAARRIGTAAGWTEAVEIALLVEGCGSDGGVKKFLEIHLNDWSLSNPGPSSIRLIEWPALAGPRSSGGRSQGPYRLGAVPALVHVSERAWQRILLGERRAIESPFDDEITVTPERASQLAVEGEFVKAKGLVESSLRAIYEGHIDITALLREREGRMLLAQLWEELAKVEMEMGIWRIGLDSVERARSLYQTIGHPMGIARTLQLRCHLLGQCDDPALLREHLVQARWAAEDARKHLDGASPPEARRGLSRAYYVGVLGQSESKLGNMRKAEKNLLYAHRAALEGGSPQWGAIWALRLAQNALRAKDLTAAEKYLFAGLELSSHLTLAGEAVLTRVVSEVHLATQRWDEAAAWLAKARRIGEERAMSNQLRRVRELEVQLEGKRR